MVSQCVNARRTPIQISAAHSKPSSAKFHLNFWYVWGQAADGQMKTVDRFKDSLVTFSPERELAEQWKKKPNICFACNPWVRNDFTPGILLLWNSRLCNWMDVTLTCLAVVNICSLISNINPLQITTCSPFQGDRAWSVGSQTQS